MTTLRNPSLMTDAEWNRRFEALADSERAAMQRQAGALGVNLRHVDPAQYGAAYQQEQQEQLAQAEREKELQRLQQPLSVRPEISERDLAARARRLGVNEQTFIANYKQGQLAEIEAERQRQQQLAELTRQRKEAENAAQQAEMNRRAQELFG